MDRLDPRPDLKTVFIVTHFKKEYTEKGFNPKVDMTDPRPEASIGTGLASAFMPNMVGGAAAMAQARAAQAQMREDAEAMARTCKRAKMPGMR